MFKVIPAILTNSPNEAREMLRRVEEAGLDRAQIDIIDGIFANNKTIDPSALENLDLDLSLDFHLMVEEPINWVEKCARAGADRIIGQIEKMHDQVEFLSRVQQVGKDIGLAIDFKTPVTSIDKTILTNLDAVLVMSVKAGFGGQQFDKYALDKIKKLDEIRARDDTPFKIIDDGGITLETIDNARQVGVDEVVVGRRLFAGDLKANIEKFIKAAYGQD